MKHWQFISLYNSEHQHLPPVQTLSSGGFNALQDYTLRSASGREPSTELPCCHCCLLSRCWRRASTFNLLPFKVLQALLPWQAGEDSLISALHLCTGSPESGLPPLPEAGGGDFGPSGSPWCGAALAETEMHTLNSTCKKNCLPRVLSVLSYR